MDKSVVVALISGTFSTFSALGAVFLKDWLETRRLQRAQQAPPPPAAPTASASKPIPSPSPAAPSRMPTAAGRSTRLRPVLIVAGSVLTGMLSRAVRPMFSGPVHYDSIITLVLLAAFVLWLAMNHRRRGGVIGFELENLAVWSGWACGWLLVHGQIWGDLVSIAVVGFFLSGVIGAAIVAIRPRARRTGEPVGSP